MPMSKPRAKKMSASEAHALREAQLLAESKPKPLPRRRRMNDEMRERLSGLRFFYHFGDSSQRNTSEDAPHVIDIPLRQVSPA